jgi:MFS family permease
VVTVTTNGLAYTAVAEYAGRAWAGRALGIQNTGQNLLAAATPPVLGLLAARSAYGVAFATAAVFPLVSALLIPIRFEHAPIHDEPALAGEVDMPISAADDPVGGEDAAADR